MARRQGACNADRVIAVSAPREGALALHTRPACVRRRAAGSLVACLLLLGLFSTAVRAVEPTREDLEATYEWYDGLGFPDVRELELIRVYPGYATEVAGGPPERYFLHAFLLSSDESEFEVLHLDLTRATYERSDPGASSEDWIGFEAMLVEEHAEALLEAPEEHEGSLYVPLTRARVFLIARSCAARGRGELAHRLCVKGHSFIGRAKSRSFRDALAAELSELWIWHTIVDFGDPEIGRPELLARLRRFVSQFPESRYLERAKKSVEILERMVEEDRLHAQEPTRELADLSVEERIEELIFRLRDQNGRQFGQPGACEIFSDPRGEKSPADRLVGMDLAAVPQLIEALDDDRFTRSVGFIRDFGFSHIVLRVSDVALAVLERIAGRGFDPERTHYSSSIIGPHAEVVRDEALEWWNQMQTLGEERMLIAGVERADRSSLWQASRLVTRYPESAIGALERGLNSIPTDLQRGTRQSIRAGMLELIGGLEAEGATEILRRELASDSPEARPLVAAKLLFVRGEKDEAVDAVIERWRREDSTGIEHWFLVSCGRTRAITALTEIYPRRSIDTRVAIVRSFIWRGSFGFTVATGEGPPELRPETPEEGVAGAIEDLLHLALEDTDCRNGSYSTWGTVSLRNPRICDLAAFALSTISPERFSFDPESSFLERDRRRVSWLNEKRRADGCPLLPIPERLAVEPVKPEVIDPLIRRLVAVGTDEERLRARHAIEECGPGALAPIVAASEALADEDPAAEHFRIASRRAASFVLESSVGAGSVPPSDEVRSLIEALEGRPFEGERTVDLVIRALTDLPEGAIGVRLRARRDVGGAGFRVEIVLVGGDDRAMASRKGWLSYKIVEVDGVTLCDSSGSQSLEYALTPECYQDWIEEVENAIDRGHALQVIARLSVLTKR